MPLRHHGHRGRDSRRRAVDHELRRGRRDVPRQGWSIKRPPRSHRFASRSIWWRRAPVSALWSRGRLESRGCPAWRGRAARPRRGNERKSRMRESAREAIRQLRKAGGGPLRGAPANAGDGTTARTERTGPETTLVRVQRLDARPIYGVNDPKAVAVPARPRVCIPAGLGSRRVRAIRSRSARRSCPRRAASAAGTTARRWRRCCLRVDTAAARARRGWFGAASARRARAASRGRLDTGCMALPDSGCVGRRDTHRVNHVNDLEHVCTKHDMTRQHAGAAPSPSGGAARDASTWSRGQPPGCRSVGPSCCEDWTWCLRLAGAPGLSYGVGRAGCFRPGGRSRRMSWRTVVEVETRAGAQDGRARIHGSIAQRRILSSCSGLFTGFLILRRRNARGFGYFRRPAADVDREAARRVPTRSVH